MQAICAASGGDIRQAINAAQLWCAGGQAAAAGLPAAFTAAGSASEGDSALPAGSLSGAEAALMRCASAAAAAAADTEAQPRAVPVAAADGSGSDLGASAAAIDMDTDMQVPPAGGGAGGQAHADAGSPPAGAGALAGLLSQAAAAHGGHMVLHVPQPASAPSGHAGGQAPDADGQAGQAGQGAGATPAADGVAQSAEGAGVGAPAAAALERAGDASHCAPASAAARCAQWLSYADACEAARQRPLAER